MCPAGCRDEIYFLNKTDSIHILSHSNYQLEVLDALDGHTIGQWPWKRSAADDGIHEFASALGEQSDRNIYNIHGKIIGNLGKKALISMASKFLDLPGEQIMTYYPDGTVKIWAITGAKDSEEAKKRYDNPYYILNQRQTAQGYNLVNLGGL